jgi:hypothetical protein
MGQLVEALCYKPEGRRFDGITGIFQWLIPSGIPASNRNEYQEYFLDC